MGGTVAAMGGTYNELPARISYEGRQLPFFNASSLVLYRCASM